MNIENLMSEDEKLFEAAKEDFLSDLYMEDSLDDIKKYLDGITPELIDVASKYFLKAERYDVLQWFAEIKQQY